MYKVKDSNSVASLQHALEVASEPNDTLRGALAKDGGSLVRGMRGPPGRSVPFSGGFISEKK